MSYFLRSMGMFFYPMTILALVVAGLSIKKTVDLYLRRDLGRGEMEKGLHAIIFWGGVSLVLGVIGQVSGIYNALNVISRATEISMQVVARGIAESYTTTIFGLGTFIIAGIIWFCLLSRFRKLTRS